MFSVIKTKQNQIKLHSWKPRNSKILLEQTYSVEIKISIKYLTFQCVLTKTAAGGLPHQLSSSLKIKLSRETSWPALVGLNSASLQLIQSFHYFQWEQLSSSSRVNGCIIMSVITNVMHIPWLARKMIRGLNRHVLFRCMSLSWAHHLGTGCHLSLFLLLLLLNMLILGSNQTSLLQACPKTMQGQLASLKKDIKDLTVSIICFPVHTHTHRHPRDFNHTKDSSLWMAVTSCIKNSASPPVM